MKKLSEATAIQRQIVKKQKQLAPEYPTGSNQKSPP